MFGKWKSNEDVNTFLKTTQNVRKKTDVDGTFYTKVEWKK